MLDDVSNRLTFMDPIDPQTPQEEVKRISQSNECLRWLYETHLKGRYQHQEIQSILGLVKLVLIPRLQSLQNPDSLSYFELVSILKNVLSKFK